MEIRIITGFARSGKSTTLKELKRLGYPVASTSDTLSEITARCILALSQREEEITDIIVSALTEKTSTSNLLVSGLTHLPYKDACRQAKINIAEYVIVPIFGRQALVEAALKDLYQSTSPIGFFESIGGDEHRILTKVLAQNGYDYKVYEICSETSVTGIDIRESVPGAVEVHNDGHSFKHIQELISN